MAADLQYGPQFIASEVSSPAASLTATDELTSEGEARPDLVAFAQALSDGGVQLFVADWDPNSTQQKELFEDGQNYLPLILASNPDHTLNQVAIDEGITSFPTWRFQDGTEVAGALSLEEISTRSGITVPQDDKPSFFPVGDRTVEIGAPLHIGVDAYDPDDTSLTVTVTSANPNLVEATVLTGNRSLRLSTQGYGDMVFELFEQRAPRPTGRIVELTEDDFYNGLTFHRIFDDFVIQGGDPLGNGTGGSTLGNFDDQFNPDLQHVSTGTLSYAKSDDDTNDSQFFITEGPLRLLDFNHSVFGQLVEGERVREAISQVPNTNGAVDPTFLSNFGPITIADASIFNDTENSLVMLKGLSTGQTNVTVTVTDGDGNQSSETFAVNVVADENNGAPYLNDLSDVTTTVGTPAQIQLSSVDVEGDPVSYFARRIGTVDYTTDIDQSTGVVTLTPPSGFTGTFDVQVGVRSAEASLATDSQIVTVTVEPATLIDLAGPVPTQATVGRAFRHDVVHPGEGDGFTYSIASGPSGLSIDPGTGVISWTPSADQVGDNLLTLRYSDAGGNSRDQDFTINVGVDPVAEFRLQIEDFEGNQISTLASGDEFLVVIDARDLRLSSGVASGYLDIFYDPALAQPVGNELTVEIGFDANGNELNNNLNETPFSFGNNFRTLRRGSAAEPGLIDEIGAFAFTPPGAQAELVTIRMRALAAGELIFSSDPADLSDNEVLLHGRDTEVPASEVVYGFGSASVEIIDSTATADVSVSATTSVATVVPGEILTYTVNVINAGPSGANDIVVTTVLPAGVTLLATDLSQGTFNSATGTANIPSLSAGGVSTITIRGIVDDGTSGSLSFVASVSSAQTDPNPSNNSASADVSVQNPVPVATGLVLNASPIDGYEVLRLMAQGESNPRSQVGFAMGTGLGRTVVPGTGTELGIIHEQTLSVGLNLFGEGAISSYPFADATGIVYFQAYEFSPDATVSNIIQADFSTSPPSIVNMSPAGSFDSRFPAGAEPIIIPNFSGEFSASGINTADDGSTWYEFEAAQSGRLVAELTYADGKYAMAGLFKDGTVVAGSSSTGAGSAAARLESEVVQGTTYQLLITGTSPDVALNLQNMVTQNSPLTVHGTPGNDVFSVIAGDQLQFSINGVSYSYDYSDTDSVTVLGGGGDDSITVVGQSTADLAIVRAIQASVFGDRYEVHVEDIDQIEVQIANTAPVLQNASNTIDVNGDGRTSVIDALQIINRLNSGSSARIDSLIASGLRAIDLGFLDVNGDNSVTSLDALVVINRLQRSLSPIGEAESFSYPTDGLAQDDEDDKRVADDLLELLASDSRD